MVLIFEDSDQSMKKLSESLEPVTLPQYGTNYTYLIFNKHLSNLLLIFALVVDALQLPHVIYSICN